MNCTVQLFHGPGHQSRTTCDVEEEHTIHHVVYGEFQQDATWTGGDAFTDSMDGPTTHPAKSPDRGTPRVLTCAIARRELALALIKCFSREELSMMFDELPDGFEPMRTLAHAVGTAWADYEMPEVIE